MTESDGPGNGQVMVADLWFRTFLAAVQSPSLPRRPGGDQMNPAEVADWGVEQFTNRFVAQDEEQDDE